MNFDAIKIRSAPETLVEKILEQIDAGQLKVAVDRHYPLRKLAEALRGE